MVEYDINWLKERGFFERTVPLDVEGRSVLVDERNLLAYVEVSSNEEVEDIKRGLSSYKVEYIWFLFPATGKLKVFRRTGGVKWFYYSPRMRGDYLKSRVDKLNKFSSNNMNVLFDIRDIVDRFYWQLWEHRILMARSVKQLKEDKNRLLVVQHLMDRLIFFYFLAQLKLVKIGNAEREWVLDRRNTREFFKWICDRLDEEGLREFLNGIFFDGLGEVNESGWSSTRFNIEGEEFSVVLPCLNGGLFVEQEVEGIPERKVKIFGVKRLILDVLNDYNWIVGEESPEDEDVIGDLTPEVIGHIYEKFVVSLEQIGIGKIRLADVQAVREELKYGRKKIGAYYTPEEITNYISTNTIHPWIRDRLKERFGEEGESLFDDLFKKDNFSKEELEIMKYLYFELLAKIRVCDNACGSGSFLIAAGEVLFRLYSRVLRVLEDKLPEDGRVKEVLNEIKGSPSEAYYIVRQIIVNNLYGVDIMEGAVEIAKLRFWLWLISQVDPRKVKSKRIETLPNLDFNLMVGNSLIGFIDIDDVEFDFAAEKPKERWETLTAKQFLLTKWTEEEKVEWLKELAAEKRRFKTLPAQEAVKLKEKLDRELDKARGFLNEKFYSMLTAKGIKISKEEFLKLKPFHWGFEFYEVFDLERPKEERGFDAVIGNPPHGAKIIEIEKTMWKNFYKVVERGLDSAKVFVERSIALLHQNAPLALVVPKPSTYSYSWEDFREFIRGYSITQLIDLGRAFEDVKHEQIVIIVWRKEGSHYEYIGGYFNKFEGRIIEERIPSNFLKDYDILACNLTRKEIPIARYFLEREFLRLSDLGVDVFRGLPRKFKSRSGEPCYKGKEIGRYYLSTPAERVNLNKIDQGRILRLRREKIIAQRIIAHVTKPSERIILMSYPDTERRLTFETVTNITLPKDSNVSIKVLSLLLNSRFISWFTYLFIYNKAIRDMDFDAYFARKIILPARLEEACSCLEKLTNYMLFLNETKERRTMEKELNEFLNERIIDSIIYELYFKEKFEDGIKTNLLKLVEYYLKDISGLNSDEQKLETIKKIIEKIKNDEKIMEQIEKIKSHPWVRVIEGREK